MHGTGFTDAVTAFTQCSQNIPSTQIACLAIVIMRLSIFIAR